MSFVFDIGVTINNRYTILTQMPSSNAFVNFYKAHDTVLERDVLLKFAIQTDHARSIELFKQEAKVLAQIEHAHIVPIYDYGKEDQYPYQVQRFLTGGNLQKFLDQYPKGLTMIAVMQLAQQLGSALDYIHSRGIVHRDLAENNIVLDEQMQVYITNFGLANINNETNNVIVDISTDTYQFGLLLYRALTGQQPEIQHQQLKHRVREFRPELPMGIDLVVDRLTRSATEKRFQSMAQAVNALYSSFYDGQSDVGGQIFISYARADKEYVYQLTKEMRRIGVDVWIDTDIPAGANWDKEIETALNTCDKLLLITTPSSMRSENVQDEWSYFLEKGKPVYPFIYQETPMSFRLRRRQFVTSTGDLLNDVAQIVSMLSGGVTNANTDYDGELD